MNLVTSIIGFVLTLFFVAVNSKELPCVVKAVSAGYVCLCNSTYCDTIERPVKLPVGKYVQYVTSSTSPGFTKFTGNFNPVGNDGTLFTINSNTTYQEFKGIGGAFTDSFVMTLHNLTTNAQDNLLKSCFSYQGIEFTFVRVPIAGTDFSTRIYTYDDVSGDAELKHFRLTEEDYKYKIPFLKKTLNFSKRGILCLASAWTAPSWMKTNNAPTPGHLLKQYYSPWAQYHIKFLDAYRKEGVEFWGLLTGNEPIIGFISNLDIPNVIMLPEEQKEWITNYLGPALRQYDYSIKLMGFEDTRTSLNWWANTVLSDMKAADYVDGVALHWYNDTVVSPEVISSVHNKYPDKFVIYTESSLISSELGSWDDGAKFLRSIIENLNHWSIGFLCWNIGLSDNGEHPYTSAMGKPTINQSSYQFAPVIMNTSSDEFYKQPAFYALGHFSKFILTGSVIIDVHITVTRTHLSARDAQEKSNNIVTSDNTNNSDKLPSGHTPSPLDSGDPSTSLQEETVLALASKNPDGSHTVIIYNPHAESTMITIRDIHRGDISVSLDAKSVNSFIYW